MIELNNILSPTNKELETAARLLYYNLYDYNASIDDILNSREYEYRAASFKKEISPNVFVTDYDIWQKGKWGTAFGVMKKEHLKKLREDRGIRIKNPIPVSELKEILSKYPLKFKHKDLEIIVFSRRRALTPLVFVNGIEQYKLKHGTKEHDIWFSLDFFTESSRKDWRYLLELDKNGLDPNSTNLSEYLVGVWTGDPLTLNEQTMKYELEHNHIIMTESKPKRIPRKNKKFLRFKKNKIQKPYTGPRWSCKHTGKEISVNNLEENVVYNKPKQKSPKSKENSLVTILLTKEGEIEDIKRVQRKDVEPFLKQGWKYTSKSVYKKHKKDLVIPAKAETFSGMTRKQRKYKEPKKGTGPVINTVSGNMYPTLQRIPLKKKHQAVDSKGYLLENVKADEKTGKITGDRIVQKYTKANASVEVEYEMVPVHKTIWEKQKGKWIAKDVIPKMLPQLNENGEQVWAPVYKRVVKSVKNIPLVIQRTVKVSYRTITSHVHSHR